MLKRIFGHSGNNWFLLTLMASGIWLLTTSPALAPSKEIINFDILFRGQNVGTVHAEKTNSGDQAHYKITSEVKVNIVKTFKINFYLENKYTGHYMESAVIKNSVNGNQRDYSVIEWKGDHYRITKTSDTFSLRKQKAPYSTARLYFEEPSTKNQVFSENYLDYIPIDQTEQGRYTLKLPSGNDNYYFYDQNNRLQKVIINDALVRFEFKRQ